MSISSQADISVVIKFGHISCIDDYTIECWEDALSTIAASPPTIAPWKRKPDAKYIVEAAAADFIDYLKDMARLGAYRRLESFIGQPDDFAAVVAALSNYQKGVNKPGNLTLHLHNISGNTDPKDYLHAVGKFLQHLFLAMNLAHPGSLSLFSCCYPEHPDARTTPPRLDPTILEFAALQALKRGWPPLKTLLFNQVWNWLTEELPYSLDLADRALHKALFTLLRICGEEPTDSDIILVIAQTLEAFFIGGKEPIESTINQRLAFILGEPKTNKNWLNTFYNRRNRIAHGSLQVLRPNRLYDEYHPVTERYLDEFEGPIHNAAAVLLALLQDLIQWNAREYHFSQHIQMERG